MRIKQFLVLLVTLPVFTAALGDDDKPDFAQLARQFDNQMTGRLNAILKASGNYQKIRSFLKAELDKESTKVETRAEDGPAIKLVNRGLGKANELVIVEPRGERVLFSKASLARNRSLQIKMFQPSPDRKTIVLSVARHGSLDDYQILVLDVPTGKIISDHLRATSMRVAWIDNDRFVFDTSPDSNGNDSYSFGIADRRDISKVETSKGFFAPGRNWTGVWDGKLTYVRHKTGRQVLTKDFDFREVIGSTDDAIYVYGSGENRMGFIGSLKNLESAEEQQTNIIFDGKLKRIVDAEMLDGLLLVHTRWGAARNLNVVDMNSDKIVTIKVPDCCSLRSISWKSKPNLLKIKMSSAVASNEFVYDLSLQQWQGENPEIAMLKTEGQVFETEVVNVRVDKNLDMPVRITRMRGTTADGARPVYMEVYGGFDTVGDIDPYKDAIRTEFMKRGGILVSPALRGGGEFGKDWHEYGRKQNKKNTMNDLILTSRWLVRKGWTKPNLIITTGTSNGGLTVASAAFLAPGDFGFVIPVAGVHHLLNKESLDPRFGPGWIKEYGDSRKEDERAWLNELSPVDFAQRSQKHAKLLIIVGQKDSRVNPLHSQMLRAMLPNHDSNVHYLSIKNSGHHLSSDDLIGWHVKTVIWTMVFDHLGWKF